MTLLKEESIMSDKIILAQNIKGTGKATFEGLYDIDDDPVTIVINKKENSVFLCIYKDNAEDEYNDEDFDDDEYNQDCKFNEGTAPEQHKVNKSAQMNMRGNCVVHAVHCEDCLREECSKHDNCDDCPISHCCESMFENDD